MKNISSCARFWVFFLLTFFYLPLFAVPQLVNFDVDQANKTLDQLSIRLSISQLNTPSLEKAIAKLSLLQDQAKDCVQKNRQELVTINQKISETTKTPGKDVTHKVPAEDTAQLTEAQQYLYTKKEELTKQQSSCQLFVLRSDEAITAFSGKVKELSAKKLLKTEPTFWEKIASSKTLFKNLKNDFNQQIFWEKSGVAIFGNRWIQIFGGLLLVIVLGLSYGIRRKLVLPKILKKDENIDLFKHRLKWISVYIVRKYAMVFFSSLVFLGITLIPCFSEQQITLLCLWGTGLLVFECALILIEFLFKPIDQDKSLSHLDAHSSLGFLNRLNVLTTLCFVGYFFYVLFLNQTINPDAMDFLRTIFITLFSINLIMILWTINRLPKIVGQHKVFRISISLLLTGLLVTLLITEWLGYKHLLNYILKGVTLTLASTFIAWILYKIATGILSVLDDPDSSMRKYLRLGKRENIIEIIWFHFIFFVLIWGTYLLSLLKIWRLSEGEFRHVILAFTDGFQVASFKLMPARIFWGFVLFSVLFTAVRWIRVAIERRWRTDKTLDTIIAYMSTSIFFIIALLVAGVNFEGLAIIAGALSVGIGFGLQNIVNNFVSGIILLIEKPIRPGDRIVIEGTEGYVKKISIRSTQIQTLNLSNIIVPNAELVSKNVVNLSLKSDDARIGIIVGVGYDSDVELVKRVLLEVAQAHPDIETEDTSKQPSVFFMAFEDSSLRFELYATIKDVNTKYRVTSELNFAINKAFKENHIEIPYPKMEVNLIKN